MIWTKKKKYTALQYERSKFVENERLRLETGPQWLDCISVETNPNRFHWMEFSFIGCSRLQ